MQSSDQPAEVGAVVVVGATGLIGSHLVRLLLSGRRYNRVVVYARTPVPAEFAHLDGLDWHVSAPLDPVRVHWPEYPVAAFFCALGTTRALSGADGQTWVDRDMVVGFVRRAVEAGVPLVSVVSALGADSGSMFLYNRLKGQMEDGVLALSPSCVQFWRPSVLMGERTDARIGERIGGFLLRLLPDSRISPRAGGEVASAMIAAAATAEAGVFRYYVPDIDRFNRKSH